MPKQPYLLTERHATSGLLNFLASIVYRFIEWILAFVLNTAQTRTGVYLGDRLGEMNGPFTFV